MYSINYVSTEVEHLNHAGNKAILDVDEIFERIFCLSSSIYKNTIKKGKIDKVKYLFYHGNELINMLRWNNKTIFIQYPFWHSHIMKIILKYIMKRNHVIFLLHDITSMRGANICLNGEIELLNHASTIIVHNRIMNKFLKDNGVNIPMVDLEVFDYLRDTNKHAERKLSNKIIFAGNLDKSVFLKHIGDLNDLFYLYGPCNKDFSMSNNTKYMGSYSPEIIAEKLEGSFGLIWDGDSIDTCSGMYGEYTRYNNPHKLSLYIASCLPVIVWSEAAIADFVKKEKIGFCVDSLHEINEKINSMTVDDYNIYVDNISKLQQKVINGCFTKNAIKKAIGILGDKIKN